jgi:hypothetical protein
MRQNTQRPGLTVLESVKNAGSPTCEFDGMPTNEQAALDLLASGWKLRWRRGAWVLKQPGYISNFADLPGGQATFDELVRLGYVDRNNNLTEAGLAECDVPEPVERMTAFAEIAA